jgi:transposase InsO family protein
MASKGVPVVLALEVTASWTTAIAGRPAAPDRRNGRGESHLGRGADRVRTHVEARDSRVASDRQALHVSGLRASGGARSQAWSIFVRNHASAVLACDFCVVVTATFRVFYVFVALDIGTRRILHWNVTDHPTADWTAQQFRMVVSGDQPHRWLIHDRDSIYSDGVDVTLAAMGLTILKTPARAPQANAFCERLIGSIRRECLDWLIVLNERHLRSVLMEWVAHYNHGRPHASLGPGIPDPQGEKNPELVHGHRLPVGF